MDSQIVGSPVIKDMKIRRPRDTAMAAIFQEILNAVAWLKQTADEGGLANPGIRVVPTNPVSNKVSVMAGEFLSPDGEEFRSVVGNDSPAFDPVLVGSRVDLIGINSNSTIVIVKGEEAPVPVAPDYPSDLVLLAEVTVTELETVVITSLDIHDLRLMLKPNSRRFKSGVVPTGVIDGVNKAFTLPNVPVVSSSTLALNGLVLSRDSHYTLVGNLITLSDAPLPGDTLEAAYSY